MTKMLENKQQIINILWKEHLINDSQQFHQYPHTNNYIYTSQHNHWIQKYHDIWCWKSRSWFETDTKTWHIIQINGFSILPSCCISNNTDTCTCRQTMENLHKFTSTKKNHTIILYISKLKDNLNMDTTIGRSVNDLC